MPTPPPAGDKDDDDDDEGLHQPPTGVELRFAVGARVQCFVGMFDGWVAGEVERLWSRTVNTQPDDAGVFPPNFFAPYRVRLDSGRPYFPELDDEEFIREEEDESQRAAHNQLRVQLQARLIAADDLHERRLWPSPADVDSASSDGFDDGCC